MSDFFDVKTTAVDVLVTDPVDRTYSYKVPDGMHVSVGDYVLVPMGKRQSEGVVWGFSESVDQKIKYKDILQKFDLPPMPKPHRDFLDWVAKYTVSRRGSVLKMALSVSKALEPEAPNIGYRAVVGQDIKGLTAQRRKVLSMIEDCIPRRASEIADMAGCSPSVIPAMAKKGLLEKISLMNPAPCIAPKFDAGEVDLSGAQKDAAQFLSEQVQGGYSVTLIDGVTGAGKTEVYFEAVAQALSQNKQVLILLPEIALSNAFLDRFKERFGCAPCLWHSGLTPAQRRRHWRGITTGQSKVIIGARSALFLPYADLGLIVVDEEHDPAYKQQEGVMYHARDMAVVRAHLGRLPCVLVSATPSVETLENVQAERYDRICLPDRYGGASMPKVHLIDMREEREDAQHFLSHTLIEAMRNTLDQGQQVLLFLNRRGYAPLTICRTCGHRLECPRCTAWLVEHKEYQKLQCHHCGYAQKPLQSCPSCEDTDSFVACGPGVERVYDEVKEIFPDYKALIFSSDTAEGEGIKDILAQIKEQNVDIIVGTQIIAKGHHFPKLTCVGIVDADLGLSGGDLRASERTFQLLHQVSGRAGRAVDQGHVYIQSFMPDNRVMQTLKEEDRDSFVEAELKSRSFAQMPPFTRLVAIIVSGREEGLVLNAARQLGMGAPQGEKVRTLGPAPAPIYKLRGRYRQRLLVIADKSINIQNTLKHWIEGTKTPSKVKVQIDVDPQSFL